MVAADAVADDGHGRVGITAAGGVADLQRRPLRDRYKACRRICSAFPACRALTLMVPVMVLAPLKRQIARAGFVEALRARHHRADGVRGAVDRRCWACRCSWPASASRRCRCSTSSCVSLDGIQVVEQQRAVGARAVERDRGSQAQVQRAEIGDGIHPAGDQSAAPIVARRPTSRR